MSPCLRVMNLDNICLAPFVSFLVFAYRFVKDDYFAYCTASPLLYGDLAEPVLDIRFDFGSVGCKTAFSFLVSRGVGIMPVLLLGVDFRLYLAAFSCLDKLFAQLYFIMIALLCQAPFRLIDRRAARVVRCVANSTICALSAFDSFAIRAPFMV